MIDMLKRHEIQVLRRAGHSQIDVARLAGVARRTVQRIDTEATVTQIDTAREREARETASVTTPSCSSDSSNRE